MFEDFDPLRTLPPEKDERVGRIITMELEGDETLTAEVLAIFKVDCDREYIALQPFDANGDETPGTAYIYGFREENGAPVLENIESDEEYDAACEKFEEMFSE